MASYALEVPESFLDSCAQFATLLGWLATDTSASLTHSDVEDEITKRIREVARLAYQGHTDLRAEREERLDEVVDADGVARHRAEYGRKRSLTTVFGEVSVERITYRQHGHTDLHPADAHLNLPVEHSSNALRRLAAIESTRGSFQQATDAIERATGQRIGKRQVEGVDRGRGHGCRGILRRPAARACSLGPGAGDERQRQGRRHAPRGPAPGDTPVPRPKWHRHQDLPNREHRTPPAHVQTVWPPTPSRRCTT